MGWDKSLLSEVIWDYNRVHQVYQFHQNRLDSPYDDVKIYKHIGGWVDQENLFYVRWNRIKNHT